MSSIAVLQLGSMILNVPASATVRLFDPTTDLRITVPLKVLDDVVERDGMGSFAASDPPAHWRGEEMPTVKSGGAGADGHVGYRHPFRYHPVRRKCPRRARPPPTVRPFPRAGAAAAGTLTVCAIVFRLIANGRSRSALAVLAAWAGATAAGTSILASDSGWAGIAYGGGRVAPALRTPLLTLWLSGAVIGDRGHRAIVGLVRAVVATTGAVVGVAFWRRLRPTGDGWPDRVHGSRLWLIPTLVPPGSPAELCER